MSLVQAFKSFHVNQVNYSQLLRLLSVHTSVT